MHNKLNFFHGSTSDHLAELLNTAKYKEYVASEILVYEEEDISRVYFLIDGEAKFYKVDRFDNEVFLYSLMGEALLTNIGTLECDEVTCFSNVEFLSTSQVVSFDLTLFKSVIKNDIVLLRNLVDLLARQKQTIDCMINMGMVYDVTAKVAKMLYANLEMYNSLKKQEISYRLNIQPATLSRVLAKFTRKGLIKEENQKTVVLDRNELTRYFTEGL